MIFNYSPIYSISNRSDLKFILVNRKIIGHSFETSVTSRINKSIKILPTISAS
ncbi:MAG: hypothetical protein LBE97_00985 [Holosporales bacterium]|nr:hypothetical protein [Holosporales bacterium]